MIGRFIPFTHASDWLNSLECLGSEPASDSPEFSARRNEFPVLDHENVTDCAERAAEIGAMSPILSRIHAPTPFGKRAQSTSSCGSI
jgi:hypothetical protein